MLLFNLKVSATVKFKSSYFVLRLDLKLSGPVGKKMLRRASVDPDPLDPLLTVLVRCMHLYLKLATQLVQLWNQITEPKAGNSSHKK